VLPRRQHLLGQLPPVGLRHHAQGKPLLAAGGDGCLQRGERCALQPLGVPCLQGSAGSRPAPTPDSQGPA
jgi:hypothetical protein